MQLNQIIPHCAGLALQSFPESSVDLVITSPPYDNLRDYEGYSFPFGSIAAGLWRAVKPGGVIVWIVADATIDGSETGTSFRQALHFKELGFRLHDTMIYQRTGTAYPDKNRYYSCFQYMFVFSKGKPKTFNAIKDHKNASAGHRDRGRQRKKDGSLKLRWSDRTDRVRPEYSCRSNVWVYSAGSGHTAPDELWKGHPAVLPLKLAEDLVSSWSNPGDVVLDPMSGSGQVLIAAQRLGRQWLGCDISPAYVSLAKERLALPIFQPSGTMIKQTA